MQPSMAYACHAGVQIGRFPLEIHLHIVSISNRLRMRPCRGFAAAAQRAS